MNLHQEGEFRDKLDFLIKKVNQIQLDVAVLRKAQIAPQDNLGGNVRPAKAAEFIGVSVSTLWKYVSEQPGFPQPMKTSTRCALFNLAEIQAWLESVRKTPKKARAGKTRS